MAAGQPVGEQVRCLQAKIRESEARNQVQPRPLSCPDLYPST